MDHCAINVVLYEKGRRHWAFTERSSSSVERTPRLLRVGPSRLAWEDSVLVGRFDERRVPGFGRIRGSFRLTPLHLFGIPHELDARGRHRWWAIAPVSRIQVDFQEPRLSFSGTGYHDANTGTRPLESDFTSWQWSRVDLPDSTAVLYDVQRLQGEPLALSRAFTSTGEIRDVQAPVNNTLPRTFWRAGRSIRSGQGAPARVIRTLEDSPFYARSLVQTGIGGREARAMHESLSLTTFTRPWLQHMLGYRIRRET